METNRLDILLTSLANNTPIEDWKCLNRLEKYLIGILTKDRAILDDLGTPLNRLEELLVALFEVVPEDSTETISEIIGARLEEVEE